MKSVIGVDVGFRTGAAVTLREDGVLSYRVLSTPPPPEKRARRPGELALADDAAITSLFDQVSRVLAESGEAPGAYFADARLIYELPGKGQGARSVETMAFARAAIVAAAAAQHVPCFSVTPGECEAALLGPNVDPRPPRLGKLRKGATPTEIEIHKAARKAQKKAKELRRKARKLAVAKAVGRIFPELADLQSATADWSHVVDAAAVLIAEFFVGTVVRQHLALSQAIQRLGNAPPMLVVAPR
jgi:hypothetical protein